MTHKRLFLFSNNSVKIVSNFNDFLVYNILRKFDSRSRASINCSFHLINLSAKTSYFNKLFIRDSEYLVHRIDLI